MINDLKSNQVTLFKFTSFCVRRHWNNIAEGNLEQPNQVSTLNQ
jgi:hypothetical protein